MIRYRTRATEDRPRGQMNIEQPQQAQRQEPVITVQELGNRGASLMDDNGKTAAAPATLS